MTIQNDDDPPTLSISDASIAEGKNKSRTVTVTVTLSVAAGVPVTVNYATADGLAMAGSDYASKSGSLTFSAGETSKTISFTVYGDRTSEPNEEFFVNLSGASGATILDPQGIVTILNDDGPPLVASAPAPAGTDPVRVTAEHVHPLLELAKQAWAVARPDADLSGLTVSIGDLDGLLAG